MLVKNRNRMAKSSKANESRFIGIGRTYVTLVQGQGNQKHHIFPLLGRTRESKMDGGAIGDKSGEW